MSSVCVRGYLPSDEDALLAVWNSAMSVDPTTPGMFRQKVLLDPNFDPANCLVADVDGGLHGFILSLVRRTPFFAQGLQPDDAWITAFGVDPAYQRSGIGSQLMTALFDRLVGRKTVSVSPYVPNYFIPGVDVAAYAPAVAFLERHGFATISRPLSMRAELTGFRIPDQIAQTAERLAGQGLTVKPAEPADIVPVLDFVRQHFSWDWQREASGVMEDQFVGDPRQTSLMVARMGNEVVGYAQHRAERYGPFGVNPDMRSRGIGRVLLARTLFEMRKHGYHAAYFLWTSDNAARLYAQCGFVQVRRFAVMQKAL